MAYNPSIHTASNKPYGVTNKPIDARYWYYDSALFLYRPYNTVAEVLSYLIANDRKGATVQIIGTEYWWPNSSDLSDGALVAKFQPIGYDVAGQSGITIDWQNDYIFGTTTFAQALGNEIPKPVLYFDTAGVYTDGNVKPNSITKVAGLITEIVYDWGYVQDVRIVF